MYVIEMGMWVEKNCIERIEINCPERTLYDHQRSLREHSMTINVPPREHCMTISVSPQRTLHDHQLPRESTA